MGCCSCDCSKCGRGTSSDPLEIQPSNLIQVFVCSFHSCPFHSLDLEEVLRHKSAADHGCSEGERCGVFQSQSRRLKRPLQHAWENGPVAKKSRAKYSALFDQFGLWECQVKLERCDAKRTIVVNVKDEPGVNDETRLRFSEGSYETRFRFPEGSASLQEASERPVEENEADFFDEKSKGSLELQEEEDCYDPEDPDYVDEAVGDVNPKSTEPKDELTQKPVSTKAQCKFVGCETWRGTKKVGRDKHKRQVHLSHDIYDDDKNKIYDQYLEAVDSGEQFVDSWTRYKCRLCDRTGLFRVAGQAHVAWKHPQVPGHEMSCLYCKAKFRHTKRLATHVQEKHPYIVSHESVGIGKDEYPTPTDDFPCRYCPYKLVNAAALSLHEEHHKALASGERTKRTRENQKALCTVCGYVAPNSIELYVHNRRMHGNYECNLCDFKTGQKTLMRKHEKHAHGVGKDERNGVCEACKTPYSRGENVDNHECPATIGPGSHCVDQTGMVRALKKNTKVGKLPSGKYLCTLCGFMCSVLQKVPRHIILMHSDLTCQFCDFKTGERPVLLRHLKFAHSLTCIWCNLKARSPAELAAHVCPKGTGLKVSNPLPRPHEGLAKCHICGFIPRNPEYLKKHTAKCRERAQEPSLIKPKKSVTCGECGGMFTSKAGLSVHMKYIHRRLPKPHRCSFCDYTCPDAEKLKRHESNHEEGREYHCLKCDFKTPTYAFLLRHQCPAR